MANIAEKKSEFEHIYVTYYSRMKLFAQEYVIREEDAENIVHDLFLYLWEQDLLLLTHANLFAYLFTMLKNRCIDFLRHETIVRNTAKKLQNDYMRTLQMKLQSLEAFDEQIFSEPDIEAAVQKAIDSLPNRCREIFVLSKIEGQKQKDIAKSLNISIKTVENQMAIAYKKLAKLLREYSTLTSFLFF
jgi:RNA polymerase sigma-70 factor (family 1)